jgi:TolA-binding protein
MAAAAEALANLATTNTASTSVLQDLTHQLAALTAKVDQLNGQNTQLQATVKALQKNRANTSNPSTRRDNGKLLLDAWLPRQQRPQQRNLPESCPRPLQGSYPCQHHGR